MQNLINYANFKYPFLPNLQSDQQVLKLDNTINFKQTDFFRQILGEVEYQKFVTDLNETSEPTAQIWKDFLNGAVYLDGYVYRVYEGLIESLTLFIFEYSCRFDETQSTISGEVSPLFENSDKSNMNFKLISAHNRMFELTEKCKSFLEFNSANYPDLVFTGFKKINQFGI